MVRISVAEESRQGLTRVSGTVLADIARCRAEIDQSRLLVLAAARRIDLNGAKASLKDIGIAKVSRVIGTGILTVVCSRSFPCQFTVPVMALTVVDRAMQVHGAEGISQDQPLAGMYAALRTLRYADVSDPEIIDDS